MMNQPDDPLLPDFIIGQLPDQWRRHSPPTLALSQSRRAATISSATSIDPSGRMARIRATCTMLVQIRRGDPRWQAGVEIKHCCSITALPEHAVEPVGRIKRYAKRRKTDGRRVLLAEAAIQRHGGNTG